MFRVKSSAGINAKRQPSAADLQQSLLGRIQTRAGGAAQSPQRARAGRAA